MLFKENKRIIFKTLISIMLSVLAVFSVGVKAQIVGQACYSDQTSAGSFASPVIPSRATNANRLVLLAWSGEGNIPTAPTATFNAQAMTRVVQAYQNEGNFDSTSEIWAILEADLPAAGGSFTATINNTPVGGYGICILVLVDMDQVIPLGDGNGLPVNVTEDNNPSDGEVTTTITTTADDSIVISLTGNGSSGSYTLDGQLTELFDDNITGGSGAVIALGSAVDTVAGSFTVTNDASVNSPNRVSQALAAFAPLGFTPADRFAISHSNVGGVCGANTVTINAINAGAVTDPTYTGTITVDDGGASGNWILVSGAGTFTNVGGGVATYAFVPGDTGQVQLGYVPGGTGTVNFDVIDGSGFVEDPSLDNDLTISNCEIRIIHDGSADTCSPETITIGIYDPSNNLISNFAGTVNISTSTLRGAWSVPSSGDIPQGILTELGGINDGAVSYTFVAGDGGQIELEYSNTLEESTNINAVGAGLVSTVDPDLVITTCYFTISYADAFNMSDVCSLAEVTITAVDSNGNPRTNFNGLVNISTTQGVGTWTVSSGAPPAGTFNDPFLNDGSASYQFNGTENGAVSLNFNSPQAGLIDINVSDGLDDEGSGASDPILDVQDCTFSIQSFSVDNTQTVTACTADTITITVLDRNGATATDFSGQISLTTNTGHGDWVATNGNGLLVDSGADDGEGLYTFDATDNGVASFTFRDENVEVVNINIDYNGSSEAPGSDPDISFENCIPSVTGAGCYQLTDPVRVQASAITVPSSLAAGGSRMVLVYVNSESAATTTAVRLSNGATQYPMTLIRRETVNASGGDNTMEVYGILDEDLDANGLSYDVEIVGSANSPGVCLVYTEGVQQRFPGQSTPAISGPLNSSTGAGTQVASTTISTQGNNAVIISAVSTGQDNTSYNSSLANPLWNTNGGNPAPNGAEFFGNWEMKPTAGLFVADEVNSNGSPNRWTHIALSLNPVVPGDPAVNGYVPVTLFRTFSGNYNYRAIGNSFRTQSNSGNFCQVTGTTSSLLTMPPGSTIVGAYLYWSGSGSTNEIDTTVTFGPTGSLTPVSAVDVYQIENIIVNGLDFFAAYAEVTGLITTAASQQYSLTGLTTDTGAPYNGNQTCLSGWALMVLYENTAEHLNVINLFQGFQPFQHSSFNLVPRNFRMSVPDPTFLLPSGQLTHITFEGDDSLNGAGERLALQNDPNNLTFSRLVNDVNTTTAQYNDTVSFPNYFLNGATGFYEFDGTYTTQSTTSYGTDVDTFYVQGATNGVFADPQLEIMFPFAQAEAEQITTEYGADQDLVLLVGEFVSVTSAPIADLEIFISDSGVFRADSNGTGVFHYDVTNNGDGTNDGGFADGVVLLTGNLPPGMTASAISANGWVCNVDVPLPNASSFTCTFDIATEWTIARGAAPGNQFELLATQSIPTLDVTVNIDDENSFPLLSNNAIQSARIAHFAANDCDYTGIAIGEQPSPLTCTSADQFDNVNDLDRNAIDIDDIDEKQSTNNNVEQLITVVRGVQTDLAIDKTVPGFLLEAQPATYNLVVSNNGPDETTKTITVSDTFPAGLTPINTIGSDPEWACSIVSQSISCTRLAPLAVGASSLIVINTSNLGSPANEGAFVSNTATVLAGTYNFDNVAGNNSDTDVSEVQGDIVASNELILISVSEAATLGVNVLAFEPGDLILYDPITDQAEMFLDESAVGATLTDINAVHLLPNGQILMSTASDGSSIGGVSFNSEDLVLYDPILGTATMIFDGSTIFSDGANANIDAVFIEYNNSYDPNDWDLLFSTAEDEVIGGTPFQNNDLVTYDMSVGNAVVSVNGSSGAVFGDANGDIDAAYIRYPGSPSAGNYVLSTDEASEIIAVEPFSRDDLVEFDGAAAIKVFEGDQPLGVFGPTSGTRRLNAVHIVESGYYGHFAVIPSNGSTCEAPTITLRKHAGLTHLTETSYTGSVLITADSGSGTWSAFGASGTITDLGSGVARYTFAPGDAGEVVLLLSDTVEQLDINIDVTNGVAQESGTEDNEFDINNSVTPVTYLDQFGDSSYNNNDGIASFVGPWTESNDDGNASSGKIQITGGRARFNNLGGGQPELVRTIDFSGYTVNDPPILSFSWERGTVGVNDSFQVQVRGNDSDPWTTLEDFTGVSGSAIGTRQFSITQAPYNIALSSSTQFRFRVNNGFNASASLFFFIDNVELTTETNDCNVGGSVDHYAISHSGSAISCLAENITITAHASGDIPIEPGAGVMINLSTNTGRGTWNSPINGSGAFSATTGSGNATYTFAAGETEVTFPFNYTDLLTDPEVLTISVLDDQVPSNTQIENQALSVSQSGLRFFNETDGSPVYPGLIAGRPSNVGQPYVLVVQAIQTSSDNPNQCLPMFDSGQDVSVELGLECDDPSNCGAGGDQMQVVSVNSVGTVLDTQNISPVANGNSPVFTATNLRFETQSGLSGDIGARIALSFPDVGSMQLSGRYDIPFNNGAAARSGDYMIGSTNSFVVRPFGLDVDFGDDRRTNTNTSLSLNASGPAFASAGSTIATTVKAVAWQQADDLNNDGVPDFEADLSDNLLTENFGNESAFAYDVQLSIITDDPNLVGVNDNLPVPGGVLGNLIQSGNLFNTFINGISTGSNDISFDEVGIYDLRAVLVDTGTSNPASYLGDNGVEGGVANLGRITPAYYDLNLATVVLDPRPAFPSAPTSSFTYMGEAFNVEMELQARNASGDITLNYFGDFAKLTDANAAGNQLNFFAFEEVPGGADIDHNARISPELGSFPDDFEANWGSVATSDSGVATINGNLIFSREVASANGGIPDGPFTIQLAFNALDSDGIADGTRDMNIDNGSNEASNFTYHSVAQHEFRYGRMRVENAIGSEIPDLDDGGLPVGEDLGLELVVEYWNGTRFVLNNDDSGSLYSGDDLSIVNGTFTDNLNIGNFSLPTGQAGTVDGGETNESSVTAAPLYFQAPGDGNDGSVIVELDLNALGLDFLSYDWRSPGDSEDETPDDIYTDMPRALIEFGEFRGNDRIINWQEIIQ